MECVPWISPVSKIHYYNAIPTHPSTCSSHHPFYLVIHLPTHSLTPLTHFTHSLSLPSLRLEGKGDKLASIGLDDDHSIVVWDWKKGEKLATTRGHKDKLFMICWNPYNDNQLATIGIKHIKFWAQAGEL